jgi:hypothetical protein
VGGNGSWAFRSRVCQRWVDARFHRYGRGLPVYHFCFRVEQAEFDSILGRIKAAGIKYRSAVRGPVDMQVNAQLGNVYWNEPDGHQWEMLTVSYARPPS